MSATYQEKNLIRKERAPLREILKRTKELYRQIHGDGAFSRFEFLNLRKIVEEEINAEALT